MTNNATISMSSTIRVAPENIVEIPLRGNLILFTKYEYRCSTSRPGPNMSCMKNHGMRPAHSHRMYGGAPASLLPARSPISKANQKQKMYIAGLMKNQAQPSTAPRLFFTRSNRASRPICLRHSQLSFNIVARVLSTTLPFDIPNRQIDIIA